MGTTLLKTISDKGEVPTSRLGDAYGAIEIFNRLVNNNLIRSQVNARVQGAIDGNPPISQAKLDAEGLGWMANVNWRLLEADVNQAQNPFYMLFADVPDYMCIQVDCPEYTGMENLMLGQVIAKEVTRLLDKWDGFDYNMQRSIANRVKAAFGTQFFRDKEDFRFECAPIGTVYVDDETTQEISKLNLLFIYYEWKVTDLFEQIEREGAKEAGWNIKDTKDAIMRSCNASMGSQKPRSWEYWQNKLRDHDVWFQTVDPKVKTAWGFVKEFDGKITRNLIIADQATTEGKYLYQKIGEYDRWEQIVHPFFAEIGNGHWNGTKSLGLKAYNARDAQNRLKNSLLDAARIGSQIILQAKDERALDSLQTVQMGPYRVINSELTPLQFNFGAALDKPMAVDRMLEYDLRSNIGSLRQNMGDPHSVQPVSAQQAQIQAGYENQIALGEQTFYLRQLDKLYQEVFERIKNKPRTSSKEYPHNEWEKMVAEFHKRCKEKGVPETAFKHVISVKAYRSIGRGSEFLKQQTASQIYGIVRQDPNVPQQVQINALRTLVASYAGRDALEMLWPSEMNAMNPVDDASKAQDENAGMLLGVSPIWTPDQNNAAHAATHLQFWSQLFQGVSQGQIDPASYLKFSGVCDPHVKQTLAAMQQAKKSGSAFQSLWNVYQQLSNETKGIDQRYKQAMEKQAALQQQQQAQLQLAQQTGQLLDPESQVKMARVKADAQIQAMATQADIQLKTAKTQADIASKAVKTRQDLAVTDLTTAQQLRNNGKKEAASKRP